MSIRFAAPKTAIRARINCEYTRTTYSFPANDNGAAQASDTMLHAALRHFAEHGLAAAHSARTQAEIARVDGDEQTYNYWLGICRALDRRMARDLDKQAQSR